MWPCGWRTIATDGTFVGDMPEAYADALAALQAVHARQQAGRGWTLRGPELVAIQRGLECHEAQVDNISQGEMYAAVQRAKRDALARPVLVAPAPATHDGARAA